MTVVDFTYTADNTQYVASLGEMITATSNFGSASRTLVGNIANIGVAMTRMTASLGAGRQGFSNAQQMAAAYEQKLSAIEARSAVAGKSFANIGVQIREMARELPGGIDMATQQVSALQRMGVTSEKTLVPLAKTMASIGAANAEMSTQFTQSFAQLQRTFNTLNPTDALRMGDALTSVSSKAGASATGVADFANAIAPLSQTLGMTQTQVLGFSAGFAKSGQEGYLAANVFNRMLSDVERSAREGTGELQIYADTVGMTSKSFSDMVKSSPAEAVLRVFDSLSKGGSESLRTLEQLGLDGPRTLKTITAVAQSGDLRKTVNDAMAGYGDGSTMRGAEAAFGGLNDEMSRSVETMQQLTEAAGRPMIGMMTELTKRANDVGDVFTRVVNNSGLQGLASALFMLTGVGGAAMKGAGVIGGVGLAKSGLGMLPMAGRMRVGQGLNWMGENRGKMMMGAAGVGAAGMMLDNSNLSMLATLGLLGTSIAPGGTVGKVLGAGRKAAAWGLDSFMLQQMDYAGMKTADILSGNAYKDLPESFRSAGTQSGWNTGKVYRMLGGNQSSLDLANRMYTQGVTDDMSAAEKRAFYREQLRNYAIPDDQRIRRAPGQYMRGLKAGAMVTAAEGAAMMAPTVGPMLAIGGAAAAGIYGYSQWSNAQNQQARARDDSVSTARELSEKFGVALRPLDKFASELEAATAVITTWTEAVTFDSTRALTLDVMRATGQGAPQMVIGKDATDAQVLAQVLSAGGQQSPQMVARLLNDVYLQRGGGTAEAIANQVNELRSDPTASLKAVMDETSARAESGWQAPWSTGYSGKDENVAMAGGQADQMRTRYTQAYTTGGTAGRAREQQRDLKTIEEQMTKDLARGRFDKELYVRLLTPVLGDADTALRYIDEYKGNADPKGTASSWLENITNQWQANRTGSETVDAERKRLAEEAAYSTSAPMMDQLRGQSSTASRQLLSGLNVAKKLNITSDELMDLVKNKSKSEVAQKLGLGPNPTDAQVEATLAGAGLSTSNQTSLTAFSMPNNPIAQFNAARVATAGPGGVLGQRQQILKDLMGADETMDPTQRQALETQLQMIDAFMMPGQMQNLSSVQQRQTKYAMGKQALDWAQANPESEYAQQAGMAGAQSMLESKQEEMSWLRQRAKQAYDFQKSTARSWEDYYIGVGRAQEEFQITSARAEEEFDIQRGRTLEEYQIQRQRVLRDYNIAIERQQYEHELSLTRSAEDTAKSMVQPFQVLQPEEVWSLGSMSQTVEEQLTFIKEQMRTLDELRAKGLSQQAIDTLNLADPANAQKVSFLSGSSKGEIKYTNRIVRQTNKAGEEVRDEQVSTRRGEEDYQRQLKNSREDLKKSLGDSEADLQRSLNNSEDDFRRSMRNSRADFNRSMRNQADDMRRMMGRQLKDFRDMDMEFLGDKKSLMTRINKVMEGGTAKWEPVVRNAMKDTRASAHDEWLGMGEDSNALMNWLKSSWKDFALDGNTPATGAASSMPSPNTSTDSAHTQQQQAAKPAASTMPAAAQSAAGSGSGFAQSGGKGPAAAQGTGGKSENPVSGAWDGSGNLWQGMKKKWGALSDVMKKYGPLKDIGLVPGGNGATSFNAAAKWMWQQLLADGYSEEQAAGIIGNLQQESGINPLSDQPDGPGRGIAQWSEGGRWESLKGWAAARGLNPNKLTTQYAYMRHEMQTGTFTDGRWSDAAFRKTKSVQEATDYFGANYEIFGTRGPRDQYAVDAYKKYAGKLGAGTTKASKTKMSIWQIGDEIAKRGAAAEAAAAASSQPGAGYNGPLPGIKHGNLDLEPGVWGPPVLLNAVADNNGGGPAIDFPAGPGNNPPIFAVFGGTVHSMKLPPFTTTQADRSYGNTLVIRSPQGNWYARYAHLMKGKPYAPGLRVGSKISPGQHLGWVGGTGSSHEGNEHLHFEIGKGGPPAENGYNVNPFAVMAAHGVRLAKGGIATAAAMAMIGEAGDHEAVIPLNRHGIEVLAEAMGRYSMAYEARKARTMGYGSSGSTTASHTYVTKHETHFHGGFTVKADDPRAMYEGLRAEQRRQNLFAPTRGGR